MGDFVPYKLSFNTNAYMNELEECLKIAVDQLSIRIQELMMREIMTNGNGSGVMKETACKQVKELSRKIDKGVLELVVGIDESSLGGFSSQAFVRTAVVLHGNVTAGPLMAIPNKAAWTKDVTTLRVSDRVKTEYILPDGMMQYEMVSGFGAKRHMLDNIFDKQVNHVIDDFYSTLDGLLNSIDYSKYVIVSI